MSYTTKRNFAATPEPRWHSSKRKRPFSKQIGRLYVIQKHDARRLHYDLRLEIGGALASWAVPKGIPMEHGQKHLAIKVEDHPLDYADFEGTIPSGNYGAGTVMLWDRGLYEILETDPAKALHKGHLSLVFVGEKLRGHWDLIRTRSTDDKEQWLLLKGKDNNHRLPPKEDDRSVATNRTLAQIANPSTGSGQAPSTGSGQASPQSKIKNQAPRSKASPNQKSKITNQKSKISPSPNQKSQIKNLKSQISPSPNLKSKIKNPKSLPLPMKPTLTDSLPTHGGWIYEIKFDGYRVLAIKDGDQTTLYSRNHNDVSADFSDIRDAIAQLPLEQVIIDGEVVALLDSGVSSFQLLQNRARGKGRNAPPLYFYAFDLLNLHGKDTASLPLHQRKDLLQQLLADAPDPLRFSASIETDPEAFLAQAKEIGLEGILAKDKNSRYQSGRRSRSWLKIKLQNEQEFVIGGYTHPKGSRSRFGALLVGLYKGKDLHYVGRVGTGFDEKKLEHLYQLFQDHKTDKPPFTNLPKPRSSSFGTGLTATEMKRCTWLKPTLVCQIRFSEWTDDTSIRHPVFLALRDDKPAQEVTFEPIPKDEPQP